MPPELPFLASTSVALLAHMAHPYQKNFVEHATPQQMVAPQPIAAPEWAEHHPGGLAHFDPCCTRK